jgi:hypothetical protein
MSVTWDDILVRLDRAHAIAARIEVYRQRRIDVLARSSGLGRCGCTLHNYFVSYDAGKPWPEINHREARKLRRVWDDFRASRLIEALYIRLVREMRSDA